MPVINRTEAEAFEHVITGTVGWTITPDEPGTEHRWKGSAELVFLRKLGSIVLGPGDSQVLQSRLPGKSSHRLSLSLDRRPTMSGLLELCEPRHVMELSRYVGEDEHHPPEGAPFAPPPAIVVEIGDTVWQGHEITAQLNADQTTDSITSLPRLLRLFPDVGPFNPGNIDAQLLLDIIQRI